SRPRGTSSTILPPRTTRPRSASSARIERGSLIQIACVWSIIPPDLRRRGCERHPLARTALQGPSKPEWQFGAGLARLHSRRCIYLKALVVSMDLNTVAAVVHPTTRDQLPVWTAGDAWLAGGTWLFSEPQAHLTRLIDLTDLKWPALTISETRLSISATCTVAQLDALSCPPDWIAAPLINQCCRAFLASFKIWKTATVGGNICMSLPAGPMISLTSALDGVCTIWQAGGGERKIPVAGFVTDD